MEQPKAPPKPGTPAEGGGPKASKVAKRWQPKTEEEDEERKRKLALSAAEQRPDATPESSKSSIPAGPTGAKAAKIEEPASAAGPASVASSSSAQPIGWAKPAPPESETDEQRIERLVQEHEKTRQEIKERKEKEHADKLLQEQIAREMQEQFKNCLLYTSPSPRDS